MESCAAAAKEIIDMNEYELYKVETNGEIDPPKSYKGVFLELWNNELIWARYKEDIMHEFIQLHVLLRCSLWWC